MREIEKEYEEVSYKPVKKTKTHKVWIASDGREFSGAYAKKDCTEWEKVLEYNRKFTSIKKVSYNHSLGEIPDVWYFPVSEEELEMVKKAICFHDRSVYVYVNNDSAKSRELKTHEWIGCYYRDNGDYKSDMLIYTLDYIMAKIESFMGIFPQEKNMIKDDELSNAYWAGFSAGYDDLLPENPYSKETQNDLYESWEEGYTAGSNNC